MSDAGPDRIDRFEVVEKLGSGAMGVLYRATDPESGEEVAIKVLNADMSSSPRAVERFKREIRSTIQLDHPNLVHALEAGQHVGRYYYVMEFVDGETVRSRIRAKGPFEPRQAIAVVTQIARALDYAAGFQIVHRDIKPENILIRKDGLAKLVDMGLAKSIDSQNKLTLTGSVLGTPHYMSPEQARGDEDVDHRSDIYSLGASLYHMLTGRPPFEGDDAVALITKLLTDDPPPLAELRPDLSEQVCHLAGKMMARDRSRRYATAKELLDDIERLDRRETTEAERDGSMAETRTPARDLGYRVAYVPSESDILLGRILVGSEAVGREDMGRALDRQEDLALSGVDLSLANVLIDMKFLTPEQRARVEETVTSHSIQTGFELFGRATLKSELLSTAKMAEYRQMQQETGLPLGHLLQSETFRPEDRKAILALQSILRAAEEERIFLRVAVENRFITQEQAQRAVVIQNNKAVQGEYHPAGLVLVGKKLLTDDHWRVLVRAVRRHLVLDRPIPELILECRIEPEA